MRGLTTLLEAVIRRRGAVALAMIGALVLGASAIAGASVLREPGGGTVTTSAALAASCGTDEFEGAELDDVRWDVLRPIPAGLGVAGGKLNLQIRTGDLIGGTATAENVVLQDAPAGGWTATTKFNIADINVSGEQAGLVLWKSEGPPAANNAFGKVMFIQTVDAGTRVIESIWTDGGGLGVPIPDSRAPVPTLPANADVLMRLRSDGALVTAEFSTDDGATWTQAGQTARYTGAVRVGLVAIQGSGGNGGTVPFERFDLECAPTVTADAASGEAPFEVEFTSTGVPAGAELAWDFGDGGTATGGTTQSHTFADPGVYRVRLTATTPDGHKLTGSTIVTATADEPPCPPQSDEFTGNELDPRWEVRRPRETGLTLTGGKLRLRPYGGDMHGSNATVRNVLLQTAPSGGWTATTKIDVTQLGNTGDQAGFLVWRSEAPNNFAKVVFNRRSATEFWVERQNNVDNVTQPGGGNAGLVTPVPGDVYVRVSSDGANDPDVSAAYSIDGTNWVDVQAPFKVGGTGPLKVGVGFWGGTGTNGSRTAGFDYVHLETEPSDNFNTDGLDRCRWTQIVREDATRYRVTGGNLEIDSTPGEVQDDPAGPEASNLIGQPVPAGPWQATTRIELDTSLEGQQAGLLLYGASNNWIKVVLVDKGATSQMEFVRVKDGAYQLDPPFKVDVSKDLTQFFLRMTSNGTVASAQYSSDGENWTDVGQPRDVSDLGAGHLGPVTLHGGAATPVTAKFDYVTVVPGEPEPECAAPGAPEEGFTRIWNGTDLTGWRQAGPGSFDVVNDGEDGCRLLSIGGLGLLWHDQAQYDEFVLRMQWRTEDATDNSGVFVRFPDPGTDPGVAIDEGHEIQIREGVQGDGENQKTGSIYNFDREDARNARPAGEWNDYEIRYEDDTYTVTLNDQVVNTWENDGEQGTTPGYIGIQNHGAADAVSFRDIRIDALNEVLPNLFNTIGITRSETRANSQIFGTPTRYSLPGEEMPPSMTVGPPPDDDADNVPLRMPDTTGNVPNLAAFRGQTVTLREVDQKSFSKIHFFGMTTDGGPAGGNFVLRFSDETTQTVRVDFRDWCDPEDTAAHHVAIGPLSRRWRETGEDGAQCAIYHVPADVTPGKTLVSVTLPADTTPPGTNTQSYLMALTLEEPGGTFETPDLSGTLQFPDDATAPVSTHTLDPAAPDGNDGWYAGAPTVTLDADDEAGGSGVDLIQYRINGGPAQEYTAPFPLTAEGEITFEYRAIDGAGNAEGFHAVELKVDAGAPTTALALSPATAGGAQGWFDTDVQVTLTGRDGTGSGVERIEYRIGTGAFQAYTGPFMLDQDRAYALSYRSVDVAGNAEAPKARLVKVDAGAPTTAAQVASSEPAGGGLHRAPVTVTLSAADGSGSGVAPGAIQYRLDGGAWQAYGGAFTVSALGGHLVEYRSRDRAANLENAKDVTFAIASPQGTPPPDAFVGLSPRERPLSLASFARRGLRVRAVCVGVGRGTLRLTVTRRVARRLGLKGRTTLASRSVRCGPEARLSVVLKPGRKVKRALRRADGSFTATLQLRMRGTAGSVTDRERLRLRG